MQKKMILCFLLLLFAVWQPALIAAADKNVSDCLGENEDCQEETDGTEENENNTEQDSENLIGNDTMGPGSLALNVVKMVFALLLILGLIYGLLWFMKKRRSYEQVGVLENIGGISVGQNKSVQIVRIGSNMYLLGVGDNVELLKELTEEEAEKVNTDKGNASPVPAATFLQGLFQKRKVKHRNTSESTEHDFNASFQKELDKLRENRHQMMDHYEKKDDDHV